MFRNSTEGSLLMTLIQVYLQGINLNEGDRWDRGRFQRQLARPLHTSRLATLGAFWDFCTFCPLLQLTMLNPTEIQSCIAVARILSISSAFLFDLRAMACHRFWRTLANPFYVSQKLISAYIPEILTQPGICIPVLPANLYCSSVDRYCSTDPLHS